MVSRASGTGRPVYGLEARSGAAVETEVFVNGIPLGRIEQGEAAAQSLAIQHDLVPGRNLAEMSITILGIGHDMPPRPIPGAAPPGAKVSLILQTDQASSDGDDMLIVTRDLDRRDWDPGEETGAIQFPHRLRIAFDAPPWLEPPPWFAAQRVPIEAVRTDVLREVNRLGRLLQEGNVEGYANAVAARYRHTAHAYPDGLTAQQQRVVDVADLSRIVSAPGFRISTPSGTARIDLHAEGRLIHPVRSNGSPYLEAVIEGQPSIPLDLMLSLTKGILTVTR